LHPNLKKQGSQSKLLFQAFKIRKPSAGHGVKTGAHWSGTRSHRSANRWSKKPEKDLLFPVAIQSTNDTPRLELFSEAEDEEV